MSGVKTDTAAPWALALAAETLRVGGLVAFPTETVYGLGADATDDRAVARIFEAKGRPRFNPLIVHVPTLETARTLGLLSPLAVRLAEAFWPGPLTLVVPRAQDCPVSLLATAGLDTLALRVPGHPLARALLSETGRPVAAPSANPSGRVSPTTALHVREGLGDAVDIVLDGGPCTVGVESTVVAVFDDQAALLRPGGIPREALEPITGALSLAGGPSGKPSSPGQLASHYAPKARVRLNALSAGPSESVLAFGPDPIPGGGPVLNLSERGDLGEAAAALFGSLRALDDAGAAGIAVMPIPSHGLGEAINDRLRRAAAPDRETSS